MPLFPFSKYAEERPVISLAPEARVPLVGSGIFFLPISFRKDNVYLSHISRPSLYRPPKKVK